MSRAATALVAVPARVISNPISTPTTPTTPRTEIPPSPGAFRHPRLTEIIKRQSASTLTSQKIQNILINTGAFALTLVFGSALGKGIESVLTTASIAPTVFDAYVVINLLRLLFLTNIVICLRPVLPYVSQRDTVTDIPLTPGQRALLGLPPSHQNSPVAKSSSVGYVTPPRYRRDGGVDTFTPVQNSPLAFSTGRRSTSANFSSSPHNAPRHGLGLSPSPQTHHIQSTRAYRRASDSPYAGSPVNRHSLSRAVNNDFDQSTFTTVGGRSHLGTNTSSLGLGMSRSRSTHERSGMLEEADSLPGTPSPSGSKRQPGVNYKWLYDKGARLPRSESTGF